MHPFLELLSYAVVIALALTALATVGMWIVREASVDARGFARERPVARGASTGRSARGSASTKDMATRSRPSILPSS